MANTKHLIGQGIGFSPGSVKYVVTDGLKIGVCTVEEVTLDGDFDTTKTIEGDFDITVTLKGSIP